MIGGSMDIHGYSLEVNEEVAKEMHKLHGWIMELEKTYLQMCQSQLIGDGMKIEQAAIHAKFQLDSAKVQFFSKASDISCP